MREFAHPIDEWIEPDGSGGFVSGTISGIRTRSYHSLLAKTNSPTSRTVLVTGFVAKVELGDEHCWIISQQYLSDIVRPTAVAPIIRFESTPWPSWHFKLAEDLLVEQEIFVPRGSSLTVIAWKLVGSSKERAKLKVRLLLSSRDSNSMQRENNDFSFATYAQGERLYFSWYPGLPKVIAQTNAFFFRELVWYRNFLCRDQQAMGHECLEDLVSPGEFGWDLNGSTAVLALGAEGSAQILLGECTTEADFARLRAAEFNLRRIEQVNRF
jgi:predicted glycogen debranching enzyme